MIHILLDRLKDLQIAYKEEFPACLNFFDKNMKKLFY